MDVVLPKWGVTMQEATITKWLVSVGDHVTEGQAIVEVGTDKVDGEIEAPATGTLTAIHVHEDEDAEVGAVLGVITEN